MLKKTKMLQYQHTVSVDPAFCLQDKELIFSSDALSTALIDVGSVDMSNCAVKNSNHILSPFQAMFNTPSRSPQRATDLICCKSKVIVFTSNGFFSCYDTLNKRRISSRNLVNMGVKSKVTAVDICASCPSRTDDELCFFALAGETAVSVMHFSGRNIRGQKSDERCEAFFTQPIKVDPRGIDKGAVLGAGGIISMICHPTLPYLFVLGMEKVYVWCYANLLQRLYAESAASRRDNNKNDLEANNNNYDDDDDGGSDSGLGGGGVTTNSDKTPRKNGTKKRGLFRRKIVEKSNIPDMVLTGILSQPKVPKECKDGGASFNAFKMSIHSGGAFVAVVWKWSTGPAETGVTSTCVYDVRQAALHRSVQATTSSSPLVLVPIATNHLRNTGSIIKTSDTQAIFSICFHPTEPLLFLGFVSKQSTGSTGSTVKQSISICSLSLLEPSLRILGIQNIEIPNLNCKHRQNNKDREIESHVTSIICDKSGDFLLVTYKDSEIVPGVGGTKSRRQYLRPVSIVTYTLDETWRRAYGCTSSTTMMTSLCLPMNSFLMHHPGFETKSQLNKSNNITGIGLSPPNINTTSGNRIMVAVRPLAGISLQGEKHTTTSFFSYFFSLYVIYVIFTFIHSLFHYDL